LGLALAATAFAADPFIGTWKMDPRSDEGAPKSELYTISPEGSGAVRLTKDVVGSKGTPNHAGGVCKFDGKDYPVTGHLLPDATRAVKRISPHTWVVTLKSAGKVVHETREVVSDDGKTLTATGTVSSAFSASGQAHGFTAIYTRQ
jgi:hypothetical protein